jgi:hypothetical protein
MERGGVAPICSRIVVPTIQAMDRSWPEMTSRYGYVFSVNPTLRAEADGARPWMFAAHYAINQGPAVLMIENYRSELIWELMRNAEPVLNGLHRAGFEGGWLKKRR